GEASLSSWIVRGEIHKHAHPPHVLLPARRDRPSRRTAKHAEKIATPHGPLKSSGQTYHIARVPKRRCASDQNCWANVPDAAPARSVTCGFPHTAPLGCAPGCAADRT